MGSPVGIERFEQLAVWQAAHRLVLQVYRITTTMPPDQRYGLSSQMQRAAVSVPANIAEGFKRRGRLDRVYFYNIAQGSLGGAAVLLYLVPGLGLQAGQCSQVQAPGQCWE